MASSHPNHMEDRVRRTLAGADISREGWEALWKGKGDPPPISDAQLAVENIFERLRLHGRLIAELARDETTADELRQELPQAIERLPIWLTAKVHGPPPIDAQALVRDFAELVGVHREALLRVVREQVADPAEIEAVLDDAPIPDRDGDDLAEAVGRVSGAHSQALILLGRDFDAWAAAG
jgi:hypothetical protein